MEMKVFNKTSSSHQDVFAYQVCGENSTYLEIGGSDAYINNNTFALENNGWRGVTVEINQNRHEKSWRNRSNPILWDDALIVNYRSVLDKHGLGNSIGYLQVDVEPASNTFQALKNVLEQGIHFECCTFEHDYYRKKEKDPNFKKLADELMTKYGYKIAVDNVVSRKNKKYYETWYVKNIIEWEELDWEDWQTSIKTWAGFI